MSRDADGPRALLEGWWVEATLGLVALAAVASGLAGGDAVRAGLGVVLGGVVLDRVRLRLDNRSLADAVDAVRESGVSGARRTPEFDAGTGRDDGSGATSPGDAGDGAEDAVDRVEG